MFDLQPLGLMKLSNATPNLLVGQTAIKDEQNESNDSSFMRFSEAHKPWSTLIAVLPADNSHANDLLGSVCQRLTELITENVPRIGLILQNAAARIRQSS